MAQRKLSEKMRALLAEAYAESIKEDITINAEWSGTWGDSFKKISSKEVVASIRKDRAR